MFTLALGAGCGGGGSSPADGTSDAESSEAETSAEGETTTLGETGDGDGDSGDGDSGDGDSGDGDSGDGDSGDGDGDVGDGDGDGDGDTGDGDPQLTLEWSRIYTADPNQGVDEALAVAISGDLVVAGGEAFDLDDPAIRDGWIAGWDLDGSPAFVNDLDGESATNAQFIGDILPISGGFLAVGAAGSAQGELVASLDEYDAAGMLVGAFGPGPSTVGLSTAEAVLTHEGSSVVVGSTDNGVGLRDGYILSVDSGGAVEWQSNYDEGEGAPEVFRDVAISSNQIIAAVGVSSDAMFLGDALIRLVDTGGGLVQDYVFEASSGGFANAVAAVGDTFVVGGHATYQPLMTPTVATCAVFGDDGTLLTDVELPEGTASSYIKGLAAGPAGQVWYAGSDGGSDAQIGLVDVDTCAMSPLVDIELPGLAEPHATAIYVTDTLVAVAGWGEGADDADAFVALFSY